VFDYKVSTGRKLDSWAADTITTSDKLYESVLASINSEIDQLLQLQTQAKLYEKELDCLNKLNVRNRSASRNILDAEDDEMEALNQSLIKYVGVDCSGLLDVMEHDSGDAGADDDHNVRSNRSGKQLPSVANLRQTVRATYGGSDADEYESIDENNIFRQLGIVRDGNSSRANATNSNPDDEIDAVDNPSIYAVSSERNDAGCRLGSHMRWLTEVLNIQENDVEELLLDIIFGKQSVE
jgi:hypothetical protein